MKLTACAREAEVTALLRSGHWPQACPDDLRSHALECRTCGDRIRLTQAFRGERAQAAAQARLEAPGVLWWRAQIRRRNAALERIGRPILGAQIFAVVLSLVAAALFLASQLRQGLGWLVWFEELPRALHLEVLLPSGVPIAWLLIPVAATVALVSGVVVYFASDKR